MGIVIATYVLTVILIGGWAVWDDHKKNRYHHTVKDGVLLFLGMAIGVSAIWFAGIVIGFLIKWTMEF